MKGTRGTTSVGLDVGMTTCGASTVDADGRVIDLKDSYGQNTTPTAVAVSPDGTVLCGQDAENVRTVYHYAALWKREMGKLERFAQLERNWYSPEELTGLMLDYMLECAADQLGSPVEVLSATYPAIWNNAQRASYFSVLEQRGEVAHFISEPTAAAYAFLFDKKLPEGRYLLLIDVGGATTDVVVMEQSPDGTFVEVEVGGCNVGGADLTKGMYALVEARAIELIGFKPPSTEFPGFYNDLRSRVELAKQALAKRESATVAVSFDGKSICETFTADQLRDLASPLEERMHEATSAVLGQVHQDPGQLEWVITGGGSRTRGLVEAFEKRFGISFRTGIDRQNAVARGVALFSGAMLQKRGRLFGSPLPRTPELKRGSPAAFGLLLYRQGPPAKTREEVDATEKVELAPVVDRGDELPVEKTLVCSLRYEGQSAISLPIVEGPRAGASEQECTTLDTIEMTLDPSLPATGRIEVVVSVNELGIATVSAKDRLDESVDGAAEVKLKQCMPGAPEAEAALEKVR